MATSLVIELKTVPPPTPGSWKPREGSSSKIAGAYLSKEPRGGDKSAEILDEEEFKTRTLLPAGPAYLAHARRIIGNKTFLQDDEDEAAKLANGSSNGSSDKVEDNFGIGDEPETADLMFLDPKDWKNQDHYKVLGLYKLRINATIDQIRVAHRRKVLRHHPDKKAKAGETNDDAFFKCIQKAFEVLSNTERRRQFDSVDPYFIALEQDEPTAAELASPQAFFDTLGPIFEREARFAKTLPAAPLGDDDASKEVVHHFYDYWYNFDSWRSFEYRDKEVNEGSDSRDDKRYTEKKNKNERARMKKEDSARVRGLVDLAEKCDPRIKRIKQEEKEAREAKRKAAKPGAGVKPGQPSKASAAEEAKRKAEEEKARKETEEAARAEAKKAKAAAANAAKKARRAARAAEEAMAEGSGTSTPA